MNTPNTENGVLLNGLRVTFGTSSEGADKMYFFRIPRRMTEAALGEWVLTKRPPGPAPLLTMYCPPGRAVCPLYDHNGLIAGLQLALPVDQFEVMEPEKRFVLWHAPAAGDEPARDFWTLTQYYVSGNSFGPLMGFPEEFSTLREGGVFVAGPDGSMMKIPTTEVELNSTTFRKQQCVPGMGDHFYWNMTRDMRCEDLFPWFGLTDKGQLVGVGAMMFGRLAPQQPRHYFEAPPARPPGAPSVVPDAPDCYEDWKRKFGLLNLHIYFVDDPWNLKCEKKVPVDKKDTKTDKLQGVPLAEQAKVNPPTK